MFAVDVVYLVDADAKSDVDGVAVAAAFDVAWNQETNEQCYYYYYYCVVERANVVVVQTLLLLV